MNVAVIGAGVIGMTTALAIKQSFSHFNLTIFADAFSPNTTGDGSAGLWFPYLLGDTPTEDILRRSGNTFRWLQKLWKEGLAPEVGISLFPVTITTSAPGEQSRPQWMSLAYGARNLEAEELKKLNSKRGSNYSAGHHFVGYACEPRYLLPWLHSKFALLGGKVENRKIKTFDELALEGFQIVINCTGLGARELANDPTVVPVRGQVSRVDASWVFHCHFALDNDGNYIIPKLFCFSTNNAILGGTHQKGDFDRQVRKKDTDFIHEGCYQLLPALKDSKIKKQWVGLRPGRPQIRLEAEVLRTKDNQEFVVIHNYGHGGSGVTLSWGSALDVVEIIRKLESKKTLVSKL